MTERARDYVDRYMRERYTPQERVQKVNEINDFLDSLPEPEEEQ